MRCRPDDGPHCAGRRPGRGARGRCARTGSERPHDDTVGTRNELALTDAGRRTEAFLEHLVALNRFAGHFVRPLVDRGVGKSGLKAHEELGSDRCRGSGRIDRVLN